MRSSDRSLLGSMGFSDPDKKDRRHDWGCWYVAQPDLCQRAAEIVFDRERKSESFMTRFGQPVIEYLIGKGEGKYQTTIGFADVMLPIECYTVHPGTLDRTYGRMDLFRALHRAGAVALVDQNSWEVETKNAYTHDGVVQTVNAFGHMLLEALRTVQKDRDAYTELLNDQKPEVSFNQNTWLPGISVVPFIIEVKINPCPTGDILRQLKLYREYTGGWTALASPFSVGPEGAKALKENGVTCFRMREGFDRYCDKQRKITQGDGLGL